MSPELQHGVSSLVGFLQFSCTLSLMTPWVAAKVVAVFCGISLLVAGVCTGRNGSWNLYLERFLDNTRMRWALSNGWHRNAGTTEAGVEALVLFLGFLLAFEAVVKLAARIHVRRIPWGWLLLDGIITGI